MAKVIQYFQYLATKNPGKGNARKKEVVLLFFNKTQKDIIWRDQLDRLQKEFGNISIRICHILSQEPEWSGHQGKVSTDLLTELISDKTNKESKSEGSEKVCRLVCVCGPNPFTETTQR
jgi:cytochrome-b5 reductase